MCMPPALPKSEIAPAQINNEWVLSKLELSIPAMFASETLTYFGKCDEVNIKLGEEHRLKLVFNQAQKGKTISLMPDLPFIIEW